MPMHQVRAPQRGASERLVRHLLTVAVLGILGGVAGQALAQDAAATRDAIIKNGAQLNGLAQQCGNITPEQAKTRKEQSRVAIYGKGADSSGFDALYDAGFNAGIARIKSAPDGGKQMCERLKALQQGPAKK